MDPYCILCIPQCFAIIIFFVIIFSFHEHHSDKDCEYIKIIEKQSEITQIMEFIEIECSDCSECNDCSECDPASEKSTLDVDEFIGESSNKSSNESSNDSYESSFIDDQLSSEPSETENSEEKIDVVRFLSKFFFTDFFHTHKLIKYWFYFHFSRRKTIHQMKT